MKLKIEKVKKILEEKGWNQPIFANKLDLNYSYVYRILRGERGIGKKFITNFMIFCDENDLDFRSFITLPEK